MEANITESITTTITEQSETVEPYYESEDSSSIILSEHNFVVPHLQESLRHKSEEKTQTAYRSSQRHIIPTMYTPRYELSNIEEQDSSSPALSDNRKSRNIGTISALPNCDTEEVVSMAEQNFKDIQSEFPNNEQLCFFLPGDKDSFYTSSDEDAPNIHIPKLSASMKTSAYVSVLNELEIQQNREHKAVHFKDDEYVETSKTIIDIIHAETRKKQQLRATAMMSTYDSQIIPTLKDPMLQNILLQQRLKETDEDIIEEKYDEVTVTGNPHIVENDTEEKHQQCIHCSEEQDDIRKTSLLPYISKSTVSHTTPIQKRMEENKEVVKDRDNYKTEMKVVNKTNRPIMSNYANTYINSYDSQGINVSQDHIIQKIMMNKGNEKENTEDVNENKKATVLMDADYVQSTVDRKSFNENNDTIITPEDIKQTELDTREESEKRSPKKLKIPSIFS